MTASGGRLQRLADWSTILVAVVALGFVVIGFAERRQTTLRTRDQTVRDWEQYGLDGSRIGPANAAVVVVEFGDYECPFCRRFDEAVHKLLRAYPQDVAFVYRHYPLAYHAHAYQAARWAECAGAQSRFSEAHRLLFAWEDLETLDVNVLAGQLALPDSASFVRCALDASPVARIETDRAAGEKLGVRATPTVLVNDLRLAGTPDSARLFDAVRDALSRPRRGTANSSATKPPSARLEEELRVDGHLRTLMPVGSAVLLPDGSIAISQPQDRSIRILDRRGIEVAHLGRSGRGPGEFQAITRLGMLNDTLWVLDGRLRRFTLFAQQQGEWRLAGTRDGPHAVRPTGDAPATPPDFQLVSPRALLPDGATLVLSHSPASPEEEALVVLDGRHRERNVVAAFTPVERDERFSYFHRFADGNVRGRIFPYAPLPRERVSADGGLVAHVATSVESPRGGHLVVTMIGAAGDTLFARRVPFVGVAIDRAAVNREIAAAYQGLLRPLGSISPEQSRAAADAWRRRAVAPPVFPPVEDVLIGNDSTTWLLLRPTDNRVPVWRMEAATPAVSELNLPTGSRLLAADADVLWVAESDSLGVPSIIRYRLEVTRRQGGVAGRR